MTDLDNQTEALQNESGFLQTKKNVYQTKLHICQKHMNGLMTNLPVSFAKDPRKDNIAVII